MLKINLFIVFCLMSLNVYAVKCDPEDSSNRGMEECAYEQFQKADKELDNVYMQLYKKFSGEKDFKKKLELAKKKWIEFREAQIAMMFPVERYGEMGRCMINYREAITLQYIASLKSQLKHVEYDSCSL